MNETKPPTAEQIEALIVRARTNRPFGNGPHYQEWIRLMADALEYLTQQNQQAREIIHDYYNDDGVSDKTEDAAREWLKANPKRNP